MEKPLSTGVYRHSPTARLYDRLLPVYRLVDKFLMPSKKELLLLLDALPDGKIMDIGMGPAYYWKHISHSALYGIDISTKMVDHTRNKYPQTHVSSMDDFKVGNYREFFDIVILSHVLSTWHQPRKLIELADAILKKGGILIIQNYSAPSYMFNLLKLGQTLNSLCKIDSTFRLSEIKELSTFEKIDTKKLKPWGIFLLESYRK